MSLYQGDLNTAGQTFTRFIPDFLLEQLYTAGHAFTRFISCFYFRVPISPPPPMNHFPHTKLLLTCTHNLNTFTACKGLNVNQVWEWYYMKYILHLHFYHPSAPLTPHFPSVHVVLLSLLELSTIALKLLNFPSSLPRMPPPPPPPPPPVFFSRPTNQGTSVFPNFPKFADTTCKASFSAGISTPFLSCLILVSSNPWSRKRNDSDWTWFHGATDHWSSTQSLHLCAQRHSKFSYLWNFDSIQNSKLCTICFTLLDEHAALGWGSLVDWKILGRLKNHVWPFTNIIMYSTLYSVLDLQMMTAVSL